MREDIFFDLHKMLNGERLKTRSLNGTLLCCSLGNAWFPPNEFYTIGRMGLIKRCNEGAGSAPNETPEYELTDEGKSIAKEYGR
jgi:hypothetical protein